MNCPKCGRTVAEGDMTCHCGASLEEWQKKPYDEVAAEAAWKEALEKMPMTWNKVMIWLVPIGVIVKTWSWRYFLMVPILAGVVLVFIALGFAICTGLAKYKASGPRLIKWICIVNMVIGLANAMIADFVDALLSAFGGSGTFSQVVWDLFVIDVALTIVFLTVNSVYYRNRRHVFIK